MAPVLAVALAACRREEPAAAPGSSSGTRSGAPLEALPDDEVLARARASIVEVSTLASALGSAFPRIRAEVEGWVALHEAQLGVLDDGSPAPTPAEDPVVPNRGRGSLARLRDAEADLAGTLAECAIGSDSGDLARALASMSAGIRQRLVTP